MIPTDQLRKFALQQRRTSRWLALAAALLALSSFYHLWQLLTGPLQ